MDDRYLFRGKRADNGEWVQGSYQNYGNKVIIAACVIDFATFGQCTGLKDKNSRLIFEGDLLQWLIDHDEYRLGFVIWEYGGWRVDMPAVAVAVPLTEILEDDIARISGNVHDNPNMWQRQ